MSKVTRAIGIKFEVDEERAYKEAIGAINSQMRELNSEMALAAAEYKNSGDATAYLTKKNDTLKKQIEAQKQVVEQYAKAVQDATAAHGKDSEKAQKWQTSLNYAKVKLENLTHSLSENEKEIENSQKKFALFRGESQGLGDVIDGVSRKFGVQLPQGLSQSLNGLMKLNPAIIAGVGAFAAITAAIAAAEKKLMDMTKKTAEFADEILTMSQTTGLSTETLQEWTYAAEFLDVDLSTVQGSLTKLTRSMDDARNGTGKAKDTFKELGVEITNTANGSLRPAEDVFWDTVEALGNIESATERDAASMEIFGRSAQELNPIIIQGKDAFDELAEAGHNLNAILTDEDLKALGAVDDAQQKLLKTQKAVSDQMAAEFAPYMEEALTDTQGFIEDLGKAVQKSGLVNNLGEILVTVTDCLEPLGELVNTILPPLVSLIHKVGDALAYISDTTGSRIMRWLIDKYKGGQAKQHGESYEGNVFNHETGLWEGNYEWEEQLRRHPRQSRGGNIPHNAGGTSNFEGGLTWVGEAGPELVNLPSGTKIYNNQDSRSFGGDIFNITIDANSIKEFNDIIEMVRTERIRRRMAGGY